MSRLLIPTLLLAAAGPARAGELRHAGNFGLGFGGGTYGGGISAKYFASDTTAFQGTLNAWANKNGSAIVANGDYLVEMPDLANLDGMDIGWSIGPGVGLGLETAGSYNSVTLGISGLAGLEFNLNVIPLDIVLEYRPRLLLIDIVDFELVTFGGHVRYYFG